MMSFIAYPNNIENACKLLSCNKTINFYEGPNDKNRIFVCGTHIMSTKLSVSLENCKKICNKIRDTSPIQKCLKRSNVLEKP